MLHDIMPHKFHNEFEPRPAEQGDYVLLFREGEAALKNGGELLEIPRYEFMKEQFPGIDDTLVYLFSVDDKVFYTAYEYELPEQHGLKWKGVRFFREFQPQWLGFAGITAYQLYNWYCNHRFCGRCGANMKHSQKERAMECPECRLIDYPKISPVVIVAVINGDELLMTKYAGRAYTKYALIAGFVEIGETLEGTVAREVMEEAGVKVKNIRYFKSQPWAFSDSLIAGFFADLDGSPELTIDREELAVAKWIKREDILMDEEHKDAFDIANISITAELTRTFAAGEEMPAE